jgi:signal transduction histidine kinase
MRLAPRLFLAFGFLAMTTTAGLGFFVRENRRDAETARFDNEVRGACKNARLELERQAESDRKLVAAACGKGELVERVAIWIEREGELDKLGMGLGFHDLVPKEREAFGLDELLLATSKGDVIGGDPHRLLASPRPEIERALKGSTQRYGVRTSGTPAIVARCVTPLSGGQTVGLVGAHHIAPLLKRLGTVLGVDVALQGAGGASPAPTDDLATAATAFGDAEGNSVALVCTKRKDELYANLGQIDRGVLLAAVSSSVIALILAILLARNLGQPLAELAEEARKVAAGEARPLRIRGSGEIAELTGAFDKMLDDLGATRRRLAATSRVAAWREVARRVAHEVKNPLAPIRAAVETLRRLRAREDPSFDEYFDEATRTVLDEVHRIANIVTEFTRFARLPPPRPQELDLEELARYVVQLHKPNAEAVDLLVEVRGAPPRVRADRDQIVQVLTNLVQNAVEAVKAAPQAAGRVTVTIGGAPGTASVLVADDGPGIAPEIAARLFEPYATTKATGTGLGLAIAQRIAIEHNGELSYVGPGAQGAGASFRLVLPVEGPPPMSETPTSSDAGART